MSNSTHADEFKKAYPDRFFEMFIAEQQLLGAAVGLAVLGKRAFASTFAPSSPAPTIRSAWPPISNATIHLSGSHAGVSIGEDGPSQMALEDLAMMRAVCGSTVLYPCDANQTAHLLGQMVDLKGISYLRTTREKTPIIYPASEKFPVGGSKVVRKSGQDRVAVVAAGITRPRGAQGRRHAEGRGRRHPRHRRLFRQADRPRDAGCRRPRTPAARSSSSRTTGSRAASATPCWKRMPRRGRCRAWSSWPCAECRVPGTPAELMDAAGIDAGHIVKAVKSLL